MTEVARPAGTRRWSSTRAELLAFVAAIALTLPGVVLRLGGGHPTDVIGVVVFGLAVVGAAFLLAWGAEALQLDISRGLALAVLALIAVLPEYAVDFMFTWKAGKDPDTYAPAALANMTGGNQLLIGDRLVAGRAARRVADHVDRARAGATPARSTPRSSSTGHTRSRSRSS